MDTIEEDEQTMDTVDAAGNEQDKNTAYAEAEQPGAVGVETLEAPEEEETVDEEDADSVIEQPSMRPRFVPPSREQLLSWAPFLGVILLAAILRFWGLGDKPLHHDESLHAYYSMLLLQNTIQHWYACAQNLPGYACYRYDPLLHGPFQFHMIATVYQISQWLGAPDHGLNSTTLRIGAATLGTVIVGLPYFLRGYLGRLGAWLACLLLAISPSLVYYSRFAREDIYMACFTLLMIVAAGCYVQTRKGFWLLIAGAGFALSYATKESTFLSIAVFGSFLVLLIAWELGVKWSVRSNVSADVALVRRLPKTGAPIVLLGCVLVLAPLAKIFLSWMNSLSIYVNAHTAQSDVFVQNLKNRTVTLFPWFGIILGLFVLALLMREMLGKLPPPGRHGLAKHVDPQRQPLLDTIVTMPWTHWFFALMAAVIIFLVLFTALFTNIAGGIGDGIWQGLYYWIQQQQVARGGQPWYYYFMLIPLYEQIGLVFSVVGIIRCLMRPSRFRMFLVYWLLGNVFIYSWAGEKMPWLTIHMTMPMMLLAAIGLEPLVLRLVSLAKTWKAQFSTMRAARGSAQPSEPARPTRRRWIADGGVLLGAVVTLFLLVLTLQNMFQLTYVHAADAPHEMMIYVQTSTDINTIMGKIQQIDQQKYGGQHKIPIAVTTGDPEWPFYWYLRDYTNVCFGYPASCAGTNPAVILAGSDSMYGLQTQYATASNGKQPAYLFHQYHLRTWWDEGYKPLPCVPSKTDTCANQQTWGGVGPFLWLSYGDTPPPNAKFDLGRAVNNVWQWWWQRKAIGSTQGSTDMAMLVRSDIGVTP